MFSPWLTHRTDTGQVFERKSRRRWDKEHVQRYVCLRPRSLCVKSLSETMCRACMRVRFSPMKHRCPLQLRPPTVTLGRWCWQWLVTVSCTPLSSLHPSHPLLLCSTFIWPHLLPLAFNAELGSPLIKVKASQCLGETERERGGRRRECKREKSVMKEWKASLP